jgi:hypothetical protein
MASAFSCFMGGALVVCAACASLKNADDGSPDAATDAPPGSTSGGPIGKDAGPTKPGDEGGTSEGGSAGNGDPRWPQWRTPPDAPDNANYTLMNGADGAIVVDKITGLAWQDTVPTTTRDFDGANAYCDALVYDALSDWRVPTRIEALSIMHLEPVFDGSDVAGPAFSSVSGAPCFWTSSREVQSTITAFGINAAGAGTHLTSEKCVARCVRGGPTLGAPVAKTFLATADTVTDPTTGLVWEKTPPTMPSTLANADARCKALVLDGHTMRLPGVKELSSIIDEMKKGPASSGVFGDYAAKMFTANMEWIVDFDDGSTFQGPTQGFMYYSRCVSGP